MKIHWRSKCLGVLGVLCAMLPARSARADWGSDLGRSIENFLLFTTASLIADATFSIHDGVLLHNGERQATGWAIAETALTAPQAIALDSALAYVHARGDDDELIPIDVLTIIPATWTSQLATHGIWSLASDKVRIEDRYGLSWAIGANLTLTVGAVSGAIGKRLPGPVFGIMEMVGTAPSIGVGLYRSIGHPDADRHAWIALTAWSSALFMHGLLSTAIPTPRYKPKHPSGSMNPMPFMMMPTVVSDGTRQMPGIAARGDF